VIRMNVGFRLLPRSERVVSTTVIEWRSERVVSTTVIADCPTTSRTEIDDVYTSS
jgi:hypothetical protein